MCYKGKFIVLEGGEGVGKGTALNYIRHNLPSRVDFINTREPGGTIIGEKIRDVILQSDEMDPMTELLLMFAARRQHIVERIVPCLKNGLWVICDRFIDSSFVYQGVARGIKPEEIQKLKEMIMPPELYPDMTILLDCDPEIALERIPGRGKEDRIDQEPLEFHKRVREGFLEMAKSGHSYKIVDASGTPETVETQLKKIIETLN